MVATLELWGLQLQHPTAPKCEYKTYEVYKTLVFRWGKMSISSTGSQIFADAHYLQLKWISQDQKGVQYFLKNSHEVCIQTETSVWITAVFRKHPLSKWNYYKTSCWPNKRDCGRCSMLPGQGDTPKHPCSHQHSPFAASHKRESARPLGFAMRNSIRAPRPTLALQSLSLTYYPQRTFFFSWDAALPSPRVPAAVQLHPSWHVAVASVSQIGLYATGTKCWKDTLFHFHCCKTCAVCFVFLPKCRR